MADAWGWTGGAGVTGKDNPSTKRSRAKVVATRILREEASLKIQMVYTPGQVKDYKAYLAVQQKGAYNMLDPRARGLTGLTAEEYAFVQENYGDLEKFVASGHKAKGKTK